ncbi:MAG: MinD/ParA family ATP-binding protein [Candidatus Woesearchaeota archaeon]
MPARSIAVVSLGRDTGKTTLALNLGLALRALNYRVLVFDADFTKNNMLEHLDIHSMPVSIGNVLNDDAHIHDAIYKHVSGLKILPSKIHDYSRLSYHYQDLLGDYDYIIIDTPSEIQHLDKVLENADEALILHSPDYSSKNVMDAIELLSRLKVLNLGIVLNKFSDKGTEELFGNPILEKIPIHKDITKSYKLKNPLLYTHPKSKIAPKFHRLAKRMG